MFLDWNRNGAVASQIGTLALVPQIADSVSVPVIAAGGIADSRGLAAAFVLGAAGAQIGTGFLLCPEAATPARHPDAMRHAHDHETVVTNVFTGRPARALVNRLACEIGFLADAVPDFPIPLGELEPLRAAAEQKGSRDFTPLWSGQAAALSRELPAAMLTRIMVKEALERLHGSDAGEGLAAPVASRASANSRLVSLTPDGTKRQGAGEMRMASLELAGGSLGAPRTTDGSENAYLVRRLSLLGLLGIGVPARALT